MSGNFSDTVANGWLNSMATAGMWVSLHFDSPVLAGAYASEYSGGGYVRMQPTWTAAANRTIWNSTMFQFGGLLPGTVSYMGGWDAVTQGNLLWWTQLTIPKVVSSGGSLQVMANDIALSV